MLIVSSDFVSSRSSTARVVGTLKSIVWPSWGVGCSDTMAMKFCSPSTRQAWRPVAESTVKIIPFKIEHLANINIEDSDVPFAFGQTMVALKALLKFQFR